MSKIEILDSTLRDGLQGENISFSVSDKLNIIKILDEFGVSYIEAGNPYSNPKDVVFFEQAKQIALKNAKLCAFSSTRRKGILAEADPSIMSVLQAATEVVVIFGKSSMMHVLEVLQVSLEENLSMIFDTIAYLVKEKKEVIFDAEHFFDGFIENASYAKEVLATAVRAGATTICLCDTNGGTMPSTLYEIVSTVTSDNELSKVKIGIHTHNDSGCAVANSLLAVDAKATHVQGTFIGFGERCGNADLSTIIPSLVLKKNFYCDCKLDKLTKTSAAIAEIANVSLPPNKPYVGISAFTHKAGMHADGVIKNSMTFEHISPELVGNKRRFLVSEVAGRGAIIEKIKQFAPNVDKNSKVVLEILNNIKEMEHYGFQFEAADASFELMVKKVLGTYKKHFSLVLYKTIGEFPTPDGEECAQATIKIDVNGKTEMTAAAGNGPVNALDAALRKALTVFYPDLKNMYLTDYKVRVLEQNAATAARVRVLIESSDGKNVWSTIGVSNDIIEASLSALVDSIEYKLSQEK